MFTTYLQTVEVNFPNTTVVHYTMEPAPVAPDWVLYSNTHEAVYSPNQTTIWWKGGPCDVYEPDGTVRRFWPKPTLKDAVAASKDMSNHRSYYRFHSDGTVEQVFRGVPYFWGLPTLEATPTEGERLVSKTERCATDEPYSYFTVYGHRVTFDLVFDTPCDCLECDYEMGQAIYRRKVLYRCDCIDCRDDDF